MKNLNYHKLNKYVEILKEKDLLVETSNVEEILESQVEYISFDSKDIKPNTLFVAKGAAFKKEYLDMAMTKTSLCAVFDVEMESRFGERPSYPAIIVKDIREAMSYIAQYYYNNVWEDFNLIGITGTKGKSTTTFLLKSILDEHLKDVGGEESGVVSGITNYDGVIREESHLTTPESFMLYKHFYNASLSGLLYLTMEVSSQALKYHRTKGIIYDVAAFINIGEDHISDIEHPNFEDYVSSKLVLMDQAKNVVINMDDEFSMEFYNRAKESPVTEKIITFGVKDNLEASFDEKSLAAGADGLGGLDNIDYLALDIRPSKEGVNFSCLMEGRIEEFSLGLPGIFNVSNGLCAIAIARNFGIEVDVIKRGLKKARVDGRMELYRIEEVDKTIIVDYAHNRLSFEALFESTKEEFPNSEVRIVFGCPGNKATARRHELPEVAAKYADYAYITEEDYGTESLEEISRQVYDNLISFGGKGQVIYDRETAIKKAVSEVENGGVVLVTGKGRETRQKRGTKYVDTKSDVEIVLDIIG